MGKATPSSGGSTKEEFAPCQVWSRTGGRPNSEARVQALVLSPTDDKVPSACSLLEREYQEAAP